MKFAFVTAFGCLSRCRFFCLDLGGVGVREGESRERPLVEAIGGDNAAAAFEGFAVSFGGGDGLDAGVDGADALHVGEGFGEKGASPQCIRTSSRLWCRGLPG
jgi:hypothetical protein